MVAPRTGAGRTRAAAKPVPLTRPSHPQAAATYRAWARLALAEKEGTRVAS